MNKKVLLIYYSQTGQLTEIVNQFSIPFFEKGIDMEIKRIMLSEDYKFPWTGKRFFDVMPESVLGIPVSLEKIIVNEPVYDLIVFAYQPWFLSPSIPANSILINRDFIRLLKGSNVVTLIGSRNMWICAQEEVKKQLKEAQSNLIGNIVLKDTHNNLTSAVSILHWMLNGKKEKLWGIFPKPGVSEADIKNSRNFGEIIKKRLKENNYLNLQNELVENRAVEISSNLMFIEPRAKKIFNIWAKIIIKKKNRTFWLQLFKYYLIFALFVVSPVVILINKFCVQPFLIREIREKKKKYLGIK